MREHPILFSAPMVRAILTDQKWQTRRTRGLEFFSRPENDPDDWWCARVQDGVAYMAYKRAPHEREVKCPFGQPGDRLWVRENHYLTDDGHNEYAVYAADEKSVLAHMTALDALPRDFPADTLAGHRKLRPSIHMPRWASRITLEITGVHVELLQSISNADALSEGVSAHPDHHDKPASSIYSPVQAFRELWESINGEGAWDANPWVWVVEFRRVEP